MTILHEDDCHFNLIIDKKSYLAKLGSLSFRFNVGPTDGDTAVAELKEQEEEFDSGELDLKNKLKDCMASKKEIEI